VTGSGSHRSWRTAAAAAGLCLAAAIQATEALVPAVPGGESAPPAVPKATPGPEAEALRDRMRAARALMKAARMAEAEAEARAILEAARAGADRDPVTLARAMDLLSEILWRSGRIAAPETLTLAKEAVRLKEAALGPDDPDVALSLRNQAVILVNLGTEPGAAMAMLERALAIQRNALGADDAEVATTLHVLGNLLGTMGDYSAAIRSLTRALAIREKALGPDHPDVAKTLATLGFTLFSAGDTTGIKPLFERAIAIAEKTYGPEHPAVAQPLHNLAIILTEEGDYPSARSLFERALSIAEKTFGPEAPDVATLQSDLGNLFYYMGEFDSASAHYRRSLEIREKAFGPQHRLVAASLNNLANALYEAGDYAAARTLLERALPILEGTPGPGEDLGTALDSLADVAFEMGDVAGARVLYRRAVEIFEKTLGPEHLRLAEQLESQGALLLYAGSLAEAAVAFERARTIHEKLLGSENPSVARDLASLARIEHLSGTGDRGLDRALRAERIAREHYRGIARGLTEAEALRFGARRATGLDVALSVLALDAPDPPAPAIVARVWDEVLRSRALVLDEAAARHHAAARQESPEIRALAERLGAARRHLARLVVRGPDPDKPAEYRQRLDQAIRDREEAERVLAARSDVYKGERERERIGFTEVAGSLPPGSALVAYVAFGRLGAATAGPISRSVQSASEPSYLALVVRAEDRSPEVVVLGPAAPIEALVDEWRSEVTQSPPAVHLAAQRSEDRCREVGARLRQAIWDPVARHLSGAKMVFVVPDGRLHLVNLAALPAAGDAYLIETGPLLHHLSCERDVVGGTAPSPGAGRGLLVMGDPDYSGAAKPRRVPTGSVPAAPEGPPAPPASPAAPPAGRGALRGCYDYGGLRFPPLPNARREAKEIAALWTERSGSLGESTLLTGARATEAAFKKLAPGRQVVHLATHGIFVANGCESSPSVSRRRGDLGGALRGPGAAGPAESPLLSAGLALAGANLPDDAGGEEGEDGILTAEEIGSMDLSSVQLVVLSACDTGLGRWQTGEGVLGLQRAFQIAGAGTLIMSLWSADDAAMRDWMRRFYASRLGGTSTAEAVRAASLGILRSRRSAGRTTHPFFWGALVAAGQWR
jgi:CHAT domain-containing protein/tetratricopeptide (TPR) repeat protein